MRTQGTRRRAPGERGRPRHRFIALASATLTALACALGATTPAAAAARASTVRFDAGYIISDANFFNDQSMTLAGVQHFLRSVDCTPRDDVPCLADYHQRTRTVPRSAGRCARYTGRHEESAASIIWRVSEACAINPEVLLVLLQKEQSLLTRPSISGYQKATGYACPDTAACDARYYGLFNQVYAAAWQFREYTLHPSQWRYRIGRDRIGYHPGASCGSRDVDIRNQATANLYNYTPYQPDRGAIAHPDGPGDPCSSYGNLNFQRIYRHWFGDPTSVLFPGWAPACLNYVGGTGCTTGDPFQLIPPEEYGSD